MKYDYLAQMIEDVKEKIHEDYTEEEIREKLEDRSEWEQELNDDLWNADSVTGNASGSYTCNAYEAEEYICHNLDFLGEALEEFGSSGDVLKNGAEWCDVTIRCYLLWQAISRALDEIEDEIKE